MTTNVVVVGGGYGGIVVARALDDIADVTLEGEVQVVEQLGHETQIHIQIPAIRQNLVYRQNDVVLVEEGATFAIGLPPERCHLFREDGTACRRLHKEPGV